MQDVWYNQIEAIATFLLIFGAHMNTFIHHYSDDLRAQWKVI